MKTAVIIMKPGSPCVFRRSFGAGLARRGWRVEYVAPTSNLPGCDLLVTWGVRSGQGLYEPQNARGGQVVVLERGYLGDRFLWTSVSFGGGLNGHGKFVVPEDKEGIRFRQFHAHLMQDWQPVENGLVLIMGQILTDQSLKDCPDANRFWYECKEKFQKQGYKVRWRPHPGGRPNPPGAATLINELRRSQFTVSWNSNSSVDSVLAGVPSITMSRGAMAWDVTGHDFTKPPMPDRDRWAAELAWKQYNPSEMSSGFCQEVIGL